MGKHMLLDGDSRRLPGITVFLLASICLWTVGAFKENDAYKTLKQEPLVLDHEFDQELSAQYMRIENVINLQQLRVLY